MGSVPVQDSSQCSDSVGLMTPGQLLCMQSHVILNCSTPSRIVEAMEDWNGGDIIGNDSW